MEKYVNRSAASGCDRKAPVAAGKVAPRVALKRRRELPVGTLYRHPKTRGFYLRVRWHGDAKRSSIPLVARGRKHATKNRAVALSLAKKLIAAHAGPMKPPRSLETMLDAYQLSNSLRAKSETVERNRRKLDVFFGDQGRNPAEITTEDVEAFLVHLQAIGRAPKTVKEYLTTIRSFFRWAVARGRIDFDPTDGIALRPIAKRPPVCPPATSIVTLLERAQGAPVEYRDDLHLAVLIASEAGLRLEEMMNLRRRALIQQGRAWALLVGEKHPTKSGSWRVVALPAPTAKLILARKLRPGDLVFRKVIKWTWSDRLKKAVNGLEGFQSRKGVGALWHALRSFCATHKARTYPSEGLLYRLMYEMGWASPDMAQRYVDIARAGGRG